MASNKELIMTSNIVRTISTAENKNDIMRVLGLKSSEELLLFWSFLFSQAALDKEVVLFMLGVSEEELVRKLKEFGWSDIVWKRKWRTMDNWGCLSDYFSAFCGQAPVCKGGDFRSVPHETLFKAVLELKEEKRSYQY